MNIARHATMISSHRYSPLKTNEPGVQIATPLAQVAAAMITPAFTEFAEYQVRHQICFPPIFLFWLNFLPNLLQSLHGSRPWSLSVSMQSPLGQKLNWKAHFKC